MKTMEYNKKNAKRWSIIGERPTFGSALYEFAKENDNILAVMADVTNSAGLGNMNKEMPERVINVGIAEQNMMGIATGLSSEGYIVFTSSFAPFQSMRCLEQIRVNQGYMGQKVVMVGLAGGVAYGELGFTHCTIEDVSILRSIPNIAVVTPADCMEVVKIVEAAINYKESVYIRLMDKTGIPMVYTDDYDFEIGKDFISLIYYTTDEDEEYRFYTSIIRCTINKPGRIQTKYKIECAVDIPRRDIIKFKEIYFLPYIMLYKNSFPFEVILKESIKGKIDNNNINNFGNYIKLKYAFIFAILVLLI